jgi:hypothetical protein
MVRLALVVISATMFVAAQPIPNFTPPTPLFRAVMKADADAVKSLLNSGADPNEGRFIGASALVLALMHNNAAMAQVLLDKGADPNALDARGSTPLMWAASSETLDTAMVQELLRRGANPATANKDGDTALTWAMRRGYTPIVEMLNKHGVDHGKSVKDAVERSISLLQKSGPEFVKVSGCTSCHHQSLPQMAYAMARERGITVDAQVSDKQAKAVIGMFKPYREAMMQGKEGIPDPAISVSYSLLGLAAEGYKPDETTEAMAHLVSVQQLADGSFIVFGARPPQESSAVSATALSIRALQAYGKDVEPRAAKAREWLRTAPARTTEELTMKVLGLAWAKANVEDLRKAAKALLFEQRADGGWGQLPGLESDAYATGQALIALHTAGQTSVSDEVYNRAAAFLLRTQKADGSWHVRSRSVPFQQIRESGFPHGKDQWISAAGTSWAAMALSLALPPTEQRVSQLF